MLSGRLRHHDIRGTQPISANSVAMFGPLTRRTPKGATYNPYTFYDQAMSKKGNRMLLKTKRTR